MVDGQKHEPLALAQLTSEPRPGIGGPGLIRYAKRDATSFLDQPLA